MWFALLLIAVLVIWSLFAIAACMVAGRASRMEEQDQYVDETATELLAGIKIEL